MKNKLLVFFGGSLLMLLLGLFSCDNCGPFPSKFNVVGLNWHLFKGIYSDTTANKLTLSDIENDSIEYQYFSISIDPEIETYFVESAGQWNFSLIQTVYACEPPIITTDETIDSIVIVTETNFDSIHPPGTDLSGLFDIVIRDDASYIWFEKKDLNDYLATHPNVPTYMNLILKEPPAMTSAFEFSVKYYQNGTGTNDYFEFKTDKIVIKHE